jgi:putative pyruvate formate lyase activating enzyme
MPDFKFFSPLLADKMAGAPDYPQHAMDAIDAMVETTGPPVFQQNILKKGVLMRHLVLPGQFADSVRIIDAVHERWGDEVLFSLLGQYTPTAACRDHPMLSKTVGKGQYSALAKYAAELDFLRLYIQKEGAADSSYIPAFDNMGLVMP